MKTKSALERATIMSSLHLLGCKASLSLSYLKCQEWTQELCSLIMEKDEIKTNLNPEE